MNHRVLFIGQLYYTSWYLSRELRKLGWRADVLNVDSNPDSQKFYHGEDFKFKYNLPIIDHAKQIIFYIVALFCYDVFHFIGVHGLNFGSMSIPKDLQVRLLKKLGKKIVYTHNGCLDGVSQTSFSSWSNPESACDVCHWKDVPSACSDERNLAWGKLRNSLADYQCAIGGIRKDYNDDPRVHEVPEFYCLDSEFWNPKIYIPPQYRLCYAPGTIKIYHAVGNFDLRTDPKTQRNIKSTHIYVPLIQRLKDEGYLVDLFFAKDIPNKEVRYYQVQADIIVDMLTVGWFGANAREALMLGKPVVCYIRPEWLENVRQQIPEYVAELPVISATPDTVYDVMVDLIRNPEKRMGIGRKSREFALKWHSAKAGALRMDKIYRELLGENK